jgi:hypothetical protein
METGTLLTAIFLEPNFPVRRTRQAGELRRQESPHCPRCQAGTIRDQINRETVSGVAA